MWACDWSPGPGEGGGGLDPSALGLVGTGGGETSPQVSCPRASEDLCRGEFLWLAQVRVPWVGWRAGHWQGVGAKKDRRGGKGTDR